MTTTLQRIQDLRQALGDLENDHVAQTTSLELRLKVVEIQALLAIGEALDEASDVLVDITNAIAER